MNAKGNDMNYKLYLPGQTTVQRAHRIISGVSPQIKCEITRTSEPATGCSWSLSVDVEQNDLEYVLSALQMNGITVQRITTENGVPWGGRVRAW
ncbi:MAG: hypothetical protein LBM41_08345 [Ruminococcus sp.]|jgi:hypothetical protein|nr:hypothetical protein [Ruminococcus sp.]